MGSQHSPPLESDFIHTHKGGKGSEMKGMNEEDMVWGLTGIVFSQMYEGSHSINKHKSIYMVPGKQNSIY